MECESVRDDFLLNTKAARTLYEDHAAALPIIDYHCHIVPGEIAEDHRYENLTQAWLAADHYKWRQLRVCGVPERLITGDAPDYDKFLAFASIMPELAGNPLYTWCRLELARFFGIDEPLNAESAPRIWDASKETLKTLSVRRMIEMSHVHTVCTTDDPTDTLTAHRAIAADKSFSTRVRPAFRPDRALAIDKPDFAAYIDKLGSPATLAALKTALADRLDVFLKNGCVAADCGMPFIPFRPADEAVCDRIYKEALAGKAPSPEDCDRYRTHLLQFLMGLFADKGIVCELHCGVERNINPPAFAALGPDAGFDVIGRRSIDGLIPLLGSLEAEGRLPRTLLYSLNPADNAAILSVCGAFAAEGVRGKVQQGSAWWFNDTLRGMQKQIGDFAELSALGCFVGMLTDSRSFLSYTRHEYFRRILCRYVGELYENDEFPDLAAAGRLVENVSFYNAKRFFSLED